MTKEVEILRDFIELISGGYLEDCNYIVPGSLVEKADKALKEADKVRDEGENDDAENNPRFIDKETEEAY